MNALSQTMTADPARMAPSDWLKVLARYRTPNARRSGLELAITLGPLFAIWALAWGALSIGWLPALALSLFNAAFLVRAFMIQHDCGHGSFFANRTLSDWIGRALGVLTLTPYDVWRRSHSMHHATSGHLGRRGMGDVLTLTVREYQARTPFGRVMYRLYRNPLVLFGVGPVYLFVLQNRLPLGMMNDGGKYWISAMGTNLALAVLLGLVGYFGGIQVLLFVYLPTVLMGAAIGVWLFYVQHQFEDTHWDHEPDWQVHDAALHGSSHYDLPPVLRWFTANIGIHHVHHLYARIPYYRLSEVLRDHPVLATAQRLTIRESLSCVKLHLWDEKSRKLMSFAGARALPAQG